MSDHISPPGSSKKVSTHKNQLTILSIIAIILAIIASASAWIVWMEIHRTTPLLKAYIKTSSQAEQASLSKLKNALKTLEINADSMQSQLNRLAKTSTEARNQRIFGEASYLIHMANLQLIISRNVVAALHLMKLAQQQLREITNANIEPLKHAVAKNIMMLENTPKLNITQLMMQLEQLKTAVQTLPSLPTHTQVPSDVQTNPAQTTSKQTWYKKLNRNLDGLKKLIIIRHDKKPVKPLLSSQQLLVLKSNIQLKISQAEWAVLYQNPMIYQQSLQSAKQLLERYYPNESAMTDILKNIQSLSNINIKPTLPDLSNTLKILNNTLLRIQ